MPARLILIRHGQTDANLKKKYSGFMDVELNSKGEKQAGRLRKRLTAVKIHKVYASDRRRAIDTAKIIFKGFKIETIAGLRELHFGVFEGLTYKEIMKKYPGIYKKWLNDPFNITIPGGENLGDFKKRVMKSFRKIILLNRRRTTAVVCHGGTISIFINNILKSNDFWKLMPQPASLSIVEYKDGRPKIAVLNDTLHLYG